jgi:hypothetical protein
MAKQLIYIPIFCLSLSGLLAQPLHPDEPSNKQSAILQLNFQSTRQLNPHKSNFVSESAIWSDAYLQFVDYLTTSQLKNTDDLIITLENNLAELEKMNLKSEFYFVSQADIELMLSYLEFCNHDYWQAFTRYTKASKMTGALENEFPKSCFNQRYALLKLTVDAMIGEIIPLPGMSIANEERKQQFIELLNKIVANPELPTSFKDEIEITSVIYYSFIDPSENGCFELIQTFGNEWYKKGPLQNYLYVQQSNRCGNFKNSYSALQYASQNKLHEKLNLLNMQSGNLYLNRMNDSCQMYLNRFINNQKNKKDVAYAQLKLSWWYYLSNHQNQTDSLCNLIRATSYPNTPDNQQAIYEITLRENWEPLLIKARLLFDGGNYAACRDLLLTEQDKVAKLNKLQQTEFAYRMARACDKTGQWEFAIKFYHMVMNSGLENQLYYPSYSAYYLGMIYLQQNNKSMADRYFKICRQMKSPVYEESIHRKAKNQIE